LENCNVTILDLVNFQDLIVGARLMRFVLPD
jgi:hypothetical protein